MSRKQAFFPWDSQSLRHWADLHGGGSVISVAGKQTHYIVKGNGPDVILIHGFFFDSTCWQYNIDALARGFRVHAVDLWGFGYSTRKPLEYSYRLFAKQILLFLEQLGIDSAVIAGHSLGGGVAMALAAEHPDRVSRLVLVDAAGLPNPDPLTARVFMLPGVGEFLLRLPVDAIRRRMLDDFFLFDPGAVTSKRFQALVRSQKIVGSIASALSIMRGRFADKLQNNIERLAKTAIPKLVVWGEYDRAIPLQTGLRIHRCLPGSELAVIEAAGHVPNLEQPDAFNRALLGFLSRT